MGEVVYSDIACIRWFRNFACIRWSRNFAFTNCEIFFWGITYSKDGYRLSVVIGCYRLSIRRFRLSITNKTTWPYRSSVVIGCRLTDKNSNLNVSNTNVTAEQTSIFALFIRIEHNLQLIIHFNVTFLLFLFLNMQSTWLQWDKKHTFVCSLSDLEAYGLLSVKVGDCLRNF